MCTLATSIFMTYSTLLWWKFDSLTIATCRNQAESCEGSSTMEIWAAGTSAKLRQSNRTDKRIDLTMLVAWPAQNFGVPKLFTLGDQPYFVWDTASQSITLRDMLKIFGGHDPLASQGYAYVQCSYFNRVEHEFRSKLRSKNIWLGENC